MEQDEDEDTSAIEHTKDAMSFWWINLVSVKSLSKKDKI